MLCKDDDLTLVGRTVVLQQRLWTMAGSVTVTLVKFSLRIPHWENG